MKWINSIVEFFKRLVGYGEKVEDFIEDVVIEKPNWESMTKKELDEWGKKHLNIDIDRRRTREFMIKQLEEKLKEN